jgi:calcium-dependent protein kinase
MADSDGSGEINYSEWIMTAVDRTKLLNNEKLEGAFKMFDKDGSSTVSLEEIRGLLDCLKILDEDMVKRAMKQVDIHRRGELTFGEFKDLI